MLRDASADEHPSLASLEAWDDEGARYFPDTAAPFEAPRLRPTRRGDDSLRTKNATRLRHVT